MAVDSDSQNGPVCCCLHVFGPVNTSAKRAKQPILCQNLEWGIIVCQTVTKIFNTYRNGTLQVSFLNLNFETDVLCQLGKNCKNPLII